MFLSYEELRRFEGTGEINADGESLVDFLEKYNPSNYQNPSNTVDTLVFTYTEEEKGGELVRDISKLLLIKRGNHPCIGWWALPGGFVEYRENMDESALRELKEETGIDELEVCQLKTYGDYDRDPRTRAITTAYVALVPEGSLTATAGDDAKEVGWFKVQDMIVSSSGEGRIKKDMHKLSLHDEYKNMWVNADVEVSTRMGTILPKKDYKVVWTDGLAADHGAIILEGYHYVKGLLGDS